LLVSQRDVDKYGSQPVGITLYFYVVGFRVKKNNNFPFKLQQALIVLKRLILDPFEFAASFMNVMYVDSKWLNTF
jgi:hypothetical protein